MWAAKRVQSAGRSSGTCAAAAACARRRRRVRVRGGGGACVCAAADAHYMRLFCAILSFFIKKTRKRESDARAAQGI